MRHEVGYTIFDLANYLLLKWRRFIDGHLLCRSFEVVASYARWRGTRIVLFAAF